jgi:chromosome segregation ATPase
MSSFEKTATSEADTALEKELSFVEETVVFEEDMADVEKLRQALERERHLRVEAEAQLLAEKENREKAEELAKNLKKQMESAMRNMESEEEGFVNTLVSKINREKIEKEKIANELESEEESITMSLINKLNLARQEQEDSEAKMKEMKEELESLKLLREEEEAMNTKLMNKLKITMKDKYESPTGSKGDEYGIRGIMQSLSSRSNSRSSSISESNYSNSNCDTGSFTSERTSVMADTRSEISTMSNIATASEVSDSEYSSKRKGYRNPYPPVPITVGGMLPKIIGGSVDEEDGEELKSEDPQTARSE